MSRPESWNAAGFQANFIGGGKPAKGWKVDSDGWHLRPLRPSDKFNPDGCISPNMFTENGSVYCRDADQAMAIDAGRIV